MPASRPDLLSFDFDERPFTVAWELTRACALACVHCRAEAQPKPDPNELTTVEALKVVDQLAMLGPAVLVLTGGDPLMRRDLFEIVEYAVGRGMRVAVSPTATALTTRERLMRLRDLGVSMIHVSVDGATPETHDAFRGFAGTFDRSVATLRTLQELEMPTQVGTTVTRGTVAELPQIAELVETCGVRMWSVFFLVPTGRAEASAMVDVETAEKTWEWLAELSDRASFSVRTTAAPQFRRTQLRRKKVGQGGATRLAGAGYALRKSEGRVDVRGVNDGRGFMFIDRVGNICPSGFLQMSAGNVREDDPGEIYRTSALFRELRDPNALTGVCGTCPHTALCGGSRARAYALTGSVVGDDPLCELVAAQVG